MTLKKKKGKLGSNKIEWAIRTIGIMEQVMTSNKKANAEKKSK
jgi:hypothetical protein